MTYIYYIILTIVYFIISNFIHLTFYIFYLIINTNLCIFDLLSVFYYIYNKVYEYISILYLSQLKIPFDSLCRSESICKSQLINR